MGFIDNVAKRIRGFVRNDKDHAAREITRASPIADQNTQALMSAYGSDELAERLRLDHDLMSRFSDDEDMAEYPLIGTALDLLADDSSQPDTSLNRTVWVTSKDRTTQQNLDDLFHKTLRLDEEIWEIIRTTCLSEGTRIWTTRGTLPIEQVKAGDYVQGWRDGKQTLVRVKALYDNGTRDVWKVRTRHREIFCTTDHKLLTQLPSGETAWVAAQDLKIVRWADGSLAQNTAKLVISTRAPEAPEVPAWSEIFDHAAWAAPRVHGQKGSPTKLLLPDQVTPDFCRLLGFLWGDGFMGNTDPSSTSTSVCFSRGVYPELNDFYDGLLRSLGLPVDTDPEAASTVACSIRFKELLLALGWKNGASVKRLPPWVGRLPSVHRQGFLDGFMDADGWETCQYKEAKRQNFEIANPELARDLKNLIDGLGWRSGNVRLRHRKPGFRIKDQVVKTAQQTGTVTFSPVKYEAGFRADTVLEISKHGEKRVFDLEVEDAAHCFVAEGMVVHNCLYGNDYEELLVNKDGVIGLNFLPPPTVRRVEGHKGELLGFVQDFRNRFAFSQDEFTNILQAKQQGRHFEGRPQDPHSRAVPFEDWEIVHFRIRGKYRRSLYGNSLLDPARFIWKRLMLLEDSALIFRLQRAPERYAFYVDVGDLPPNEALGFVNRVRQQFKKQKFMTSTGKMDLKFNPLGSDEDFFIPSRKGQDGTRIEVLGSPVWQHMEDINYFRDMLFAAIKVPKAYLGQEQGVARAVLSSEDVRFARTILRIQRETKNGLRKVCRVHMWAQGLDAERADYDLHMTVPSAIFDLAQLEVRNARADLAGRMKDFVSMHWLLERVFGMSEQEIKVIMKQRKEDGEREAENQAKAQEIMNPAPPPEEGPPQEMAPPEEAPPEGPPVEELPPEAVQAAGEADRRQRRFINEQLRRINARLTPAGRVIPKARPTSEEELFRGGNRKTERATEEKLNTLLRNDERLAGRMGDLAGLLQEVRAVIPTKGR